MSPIMATGMTLSAPWRKADAIYFVINKECRRHRIVGTRAHMMGALPLDADLQARYHKLP